MTAGVAAEGGVGVVAAGVDKDILPGMVPAEADTGAAAETQPQAAETQGQAQAQPQAPAPAQEQPSSQEADWTAQHSKDFLGHLSGLIDEQYRGAIQQARDSGTAKELADIFAEASRKMAELYGFLDPVRSVQDVFCLIWLTRDNEEVCARAKALEDLLGVAPGSVFLIDIHLEPCELGKAVGLRPHSARDLVWKLVKAAESRDFQKSLQIVLACWKTEEERGWGKLMINHRFLCPLLLEYGFSSQEDTAIARTQALLLKMQAAVKEFAHDPEVLGYSWRFEKALQWEPGVFLVKPEDTGGSIYPKFATAAYAKKVHYWEKFNVDAAYDEDGEGIVLPPEAPEPGPAPVILLLLGHGHFNSRQSFMIGEVEDILQHEVMRRQFYIVVPKPDTRTGLAYWKGRRFEKDWQEDAVWYYFTEVLRKLGPEKVDPARLYVTGVSQGGAGTWHICMKYGRYFAAAMPSGGACDWPGDSWPRGSEPDEKAMEELRKVPFRAIHVDSDNHAPPPKKDIEYLTHGLEERSCDIQAFGCDGKKRFDVNIRKWFWKDPGEAFIEYWAVEGPLDDGRNVGAWSDDRHLIWIRTWVNPYWGVTSFFLEHTCPEERRWKFTDPSVKPDSSEHKAFLDRRGYFDPPEKDPFILRDEADVEALVQAFRKEAWQAARYLGNGYEVPVSFEFGRSREIERMEFRVVKDRPYDKIGVMWLKPYVTTVLLLKMVAAERLFEDIHQFDTFGVGLRPTPQKGKPPTVEPLPLDTKVTEEHVSLEVCDEKAPKQAPHAAEFTVWVLLRHHVDHEKDVYHPITHIVKKDSVDVEAMKKVVLPRLWEKNFIDSEDLSVFGLCIAAKSAEGPQNKIPGRLPLADNTTLTLEHQILEVCKPGIKIELIIDPVSGMSKEYSVEQGSTVSTLRFLLANGNDQKAKRMAVGLPPKKKTDEPVNLEDDVVLTKAHAKLRLWTLVIPKAKAGAK